MTGHPGLTAAASTVAREFPGVRFVLAEALLRLLRDPGFAANLGHNRREYVTPQFSFLRMIENTDQLYTELLCRRGIE